ncbi:MAG: type III toxin-antitoxin system TenpIN family toxin [Lachnospiraceae bacterium]
MGLAEYDYQILKLTDDFYNAYPNPPYREIMEKRQRAYNCLLFQSHYGYFICIPYRSEIQHPYSFRFKRTDRSKKHKSGLDYTKMVIINNLEYIDSKDALIDKDEFNETMINLERIKEEALKYVEDYVNHVIGRKVLHPKEFARKYSYSALQYFHRELGIEE